MLLVISERPNRELSLQDETFFFRRNTSESVPLRSVLPALYTKECEAPAYEVGANKVPCVTKSRGRHHLQLKPSHARYLQVPSLSLVLGSGGLQMCIDQCIVLRPGSVSYWLLLHLAFQQTAISNLLNGRVSLLAHSSIFEHSLLFAFLFV